MTRKTPIDRMNKAIMDELNKYGDDIQANLDAITKKAGAEGAKALRRKSKSVFPGGSGEYASGWKYEFRKTRRYAKTTVFNEHYSLPHLLEHPHTIKNQKNGPVYGQTAPHVHIKPVEEELVDTYEREVLRKL